jgi:hypothetical protein
MSTSDSTVVAGGEIVYNFNSSKMIDKLSIKLSIFYNADIGYRLK